MPILAGTGVDVFCLDRHRCRLVSLPEASAKGRLSGRH
jgi:hypothetical protein